MFLAERPSMDRPRFARLSDSESSQLGYGRFLQADPLGYEDGLNWYAYAGGDPVNASDPSGLKSANQVYTGSRSPGVVSAGLFGQQAAAIYQRVSAVTDAVKAIRAADADGNGWINEGEAPGLPSFLQPIWSDLSGVDLPQNGLPGDIVVTANAIKWRHYSETYGRGPELVITPTQDRLLQFRLVEISIGHAKVRERLTAKNLGLPGRKDTFYDIYTLADGLVGAERIAHIPTSLNFYYSPYHYQVGPGAPDVWIMIHYSASQDD